MKENPIVHEKYEIIGKNIGITTIDFLTFFLTFV